MEEYDKQLNRLSQMMGKGRYEEDVKAKLLEISSDTHQLQLMKLHHFKLEIFKLI